MKTGLTVISGKLGHKTYDLLITGPGGFNAAHGLSVYLEHAAPAMIVQAGIAGVFRETGAEPGNVAIATREHYIHTGIGTNTLENDPLPFDLIKKNPLSRSGIYLFDQDRVDFFLDRLSKKTSTSHITLDKGPFITVSCITASVAHAGRLYRAFSPLMEAMEGAACAHTAELYAVPMIEIRAASNFVGERNKDNWEIDLAVRHLGQVCAAL